MNTIIQCFLGKIISWEEKSLENLNNISFLSDLADDLNKVGKQMIEKYLNDLEEIIYNSEERKIYIISKE